MLNNGVGTFTKNFTLKERDLEKCRRLTATACTNVVFNLSLDNMNVYGTPTCCEPRPVLTTSVDYIYHGVFKFLHSAQNSSLNSDFSPST